MDLKIKIPINNNKKNKKFKEGKVYIIYYYPPDILITQDPELLRLFRGSKDKWTIIDEKGQEYLIDAILLFYGLPIRKKELEKLKNMDDKELEYYYQNSLIYLFSTLTNYKPGFIKKTVTKLTFKKPNGKPIKIKDIDEDIELNQGDAIERAFNYYQQAQKLGSIYAEITKSKKGLFGGKGILSAITGADTKTVINIGVVAIIMVVLVAMLFFLYRAYNISSNTIHPIINTTNIGGQIYHIQPTP
jgi:hypothetical protein